MTEASYDISVLVRTLGNVNLLSAALQSLRRQLFKNFQVVIVEDGPPTLADFLGQFSDLAIRYEAMGVRSGRSRSGNKALSAAQGAYCIFLDDDDFFYPGHLSDLIALAKAGDHPIVHSWSEQRSVERAADGRLVKTSRIKRVRRESFSLLHLIAENPIPINAILFRRSLYEKAGGFDDNLEYLEDWLLWLRFAAHVPFWPGTRKITAGYNVTLNKKSYMERRRVMRAQIGYIDKAVSQIKPVWGFDVLRRETGRHVKAMIFLRKIFYRVTSYRL